MLKTYALLLAASLLSFSALTFADDIDCDKAETTLDLNECAALELDAAEKTLAIYFEKAKKEFAEEPEVVEALTKSQASWIRYREDYCDAVYAIWQGGSIRGMLTLNCKTSLTRTRTHTIWQDFLVTMENETLLPEPK